MEKRKLLIADSAEEFRIAVGTALEKDFCIRTVADGYQVQEMLHSFAPDMIVLDMMLPGLDVILTLRDAVWQDAAPVILATTRSQSDYIYEKLERLQAQHVLLKPCDVVVVAERAREIAQEQKLLVFSTRIPKTRIATVLLELGFNTKHNGYRYLCDAVELYAENNRQGLTKELYTAVGVPYNVGGEQVERSIRFALESAWKNRDDRQWGQWFPPGVIHALKRPSNGVVITRLAECLWLEHTRKFG